MTYFAAACVFLLVGEGIMAAGFGYPSHAVTAPETLVLVHVVAIGWLGLLMSGALLQFVPVLVARPLRCGRLAVPALLSILAGLGFLLGGFLALAGLAPFSPGLLPAGAVLLAAGFGLLGIMLGATLLSVRPLSLLARFVVVGLLSLAGTVLLGLTFTFALSGLVEHPAVTGLVGSATPMHAMLGLGGWMTFTAIGVSYRLLTMFLLAPDKERRTSRAVWWAGLSALMLVAAAVPVRQLVPAAAHALLIAALALAVLAVMFYGYDITRIHRSRRRKTVELNIWASVPAFAALAASIVLYLVPATRSAAGEGAAALVYLFVFGWLSGLGLAQLYKIVPFLTWLEVYAPILGKAAVPRVQDLVDERSAGIWFLLYYASVAAATMALFAGSATWFRAAALLQLGATLALVRAFIATRRLSRLAETLRPAGGAALPRLFLPLISKGRPS